MAKRKQGNGNLILSRKPGQSIDVGGSRITIERVSGNRVRLSVQAPASVRVLRGELGGDEPRREAVA